MAFGMYQEGSIELPHKRIPVSTSLIVEEAIRFAWIQLLKGENPMFNLASADEDRITHELFEILVDRVFDRGLVDGFDDLHFDKPTRESKIRNYNGDKLDKMPDLLISIRGRKDVFKRSQDWLFIECKPVNSSRTVGAHYGAKGISRFVTGDYAWAMRNALMVAYASPGYSIDPKLFETLENRGAEFGAIGQPVACKKSAASAICGLPHKTRHTRSFSYLETGEPAPEIELRHLWLKR